MTDTERIQEIKILFRRHALGDGIDLQGSCRDLLVMVEQRDKTIAELRQDKVDYDRVLSSYIKETHERGVQNTLMLSALEELTDENLSTPYRIMITKDTIAQVKEVDQR